MNDWAVSWLSKGTTHPEATWHQTEAAADLAAWRLKMLGLREIVVWRDAAVYA